MPFTFLEGFLILSVIALIALIVVLVDKQVKARVSLVKEALSNKGYVVDEAYLRPVGNITRIWGVFKDPVALYIQVSNLDPIQSVAGELGIADLKIGHPAFDSAFVVRCNEKQMLPQIIDTNAIQFFLTFRGIRYRTGALSSLLGIDYKPIEKEVDLRKVWLLEVTEPMTSSKIPQLISFAQSLNSRVETLSREIPDQSIKRLTPSFTEGR